MKVTEKNGIELPENRFEVDIRKSIKKYEASWDAMEAERKIQKPFTLRSNGRKCYVRNTSTNPVSTSAIEDLIQYEDLDAYRKEYHTLKREKEALIKAQEELKELLKDENVQRYIELADLVDLDYKPEEDYRLAEKAYRISKNNDTNKIMVYMGTFIWDSVEKEAYITFDNDPDATYKAYMDLESLEAHNITLDKVSEFEKNYTTIYSTFKMFSSSDYSRNFFKIRHWYLMELTTKSYVEVINTLKKLSKIKHQDLLLEERKYSEIHLYPETPTFDENFNPETFTYIYPANGYIEKYSLTEEQQKLVKLCRTLKNEDI